MGDPFRSAGSLRAAFDAVDWSTTPLGAPASWSPALHAVTDLALNTDFAVTLLWGPEFTMVYNEAYVPLIGDKHPAALGAPAREVFAEIWADIGPLMQRVRDGAGPVSVDDARLLITRHGYPEECYFDFCYSPAGEQDGVVEGVIDIAVETTQRTIARRRLELLTVLGQRLTADLRSPREVLEVALPVLRTSPLDLRAVDIRHPDVPALRGADRLPRVQPVFGAGGVLVETTRDGQVAWVRLTTATDSAVPPTMAVLLSEHLAFDDAYRDFLRLIAVALAQALDRIAVRAAERGLSEALQRSLLSSPRQPEDLRVAVRYQPAAEQARIGGDWYDSFLLPDGALAVVVGDVSGHDRQAAAAMAQVRNLLRGVAYSVEAGPSAVLVALDRAMQNLDVGAFATAVVARIEPSTGDTAQGDRLLRWSNAGHPPPVLIDPTGTARRLEADIDVLLGVTPAAPRADHTAMLAPGSTVVFYSDGLIERRDRDIDASVDQLVAHLHGTRQRSAEQICDDLLAEFGTDAQDDIVLLVLHAYSASQPHATTAGPTPSPGDRPTVCDPLQ